MEQPTGKKRRKKRKAVRYQKKALLKFTPRQLKYRQHRLAGMSIFASAIKAGYSHSYARGTASRIVDKKVKESIIDLFDRHGATDEDMVTSLVKIAKSAKKSVAHRMDDVPDEPLRKDTWELIARLKKHLSNQPIIDASEHTHLTLLVEKAPSDPENRLHTNAKTVLSLQAANEPR